MRLTVIDGESITRVFSNMHEFLQYFEKVCRMIEQKKRHSETSFQVTFRSKALVTSCWD